MDPSLSAAPKPRVLLLGNDPADTQWSMLEYGQQLRKALLSLEQSGVEIELKSPDSRGWGDWTRRNRVGRAASMYFSRYLLYPPLIRSERPGLFHILDHGNAGLVRHLDPKRTIVTCHDLIPLLFNQPGSLVPGLSRRAFEDALAGLKRAARVIANSPCTRRDLTRRLNIPEERIEVVPLGIDPGARPPGSPEEKLRARARFAIPEGPATLLHVGQNVPYKNIDGLLAVLKVLAGRGQPVQLVRAGPRLQPKQRAFLKEAGLSSRLHDLGPLPKEELLKLYHAADLLLYPSWYEGLGLPPLEAMASGTPVIVSNRGALPETVGDAALIEDPDHPDRFADAVLRLLQDGSLREQLREKGYRQAAKFNWSAAAERTLRIYRSLLS